ncbi:hypothetical protein AAHC03_024497 [Spirometra sp. Aus1]
MLDAHIRICDCTTVLQREADWRAGQCAFPRPYASFSRRNRSSSSSQPLLLDAHAASFCTSTLLPIGWPTRSQNESGRLPRNPPLYPSHGTWGSSSGGRGASAAAVGESFGPSEWLSDSAGGRRRTKTKRFVSSNSRTSSENIHVSGGNSASQNKVDRKMDRTSNGRWWLDSLLKLLYSHPLQLTKYVRQISIPLSKLTDAEISTPRFPKPSLAGDASHNLPIFNQLWAAQKLRSLLSTYRDLLSPRQWKEFLHKTPSDGYYDSESPSAEPEVNLELLEAAVTSVRAAVAECRYQFRNERWNCSQAAETDNNALFGNVLMKGIPETAFVYSLISAGLVRGVAEACLNNIRNCPCNNRGRKETEAGWQWEGCDHNIHYGRRFTRNLLDQMENGFHIRFLMNLHNYRVGRRVVSQNMQRYCRCHGTSGSCTMKTCYRQTPTMRTIGNKLKLMYQEASQVIRDNTIPDSWGQNSRQPDTGTVIQLNRWNPRRLREVGPNSPLYWNPQPHRQRYPQPSLIKVKHTSSSSSSHVFPRSPRDLRPSTQELVYFERPPEDLFCNADPHLHLTGTLDRECNSSVAGPQNCRSLCCGRGFRTQHYYSLENCDCKFVWCCRVECRKCLVLKKVETCL